MSYFSDTMLAGYEAVQETAYDRTCAVGTYAETETAPGKYETAWVETAAGVPCSFHPRSGSEIVRAGQLSAEQPALVKMDYRDASGNARSVDAGSVLRIAPSGRSEGVELEVVGPPEDVQGMGRWLHLPCRYTQTVGSAVGGL